ncbi:TonB-dependent receptor [Kineobactrum salinum]|uniref:TonB-dependent receptor n=1 Tax=Kineobactrum salinum TaxID=2708301 RepID=A0A6C0TYR0_9GAMM|nr:TonB-dependent receptor [Kineobactrum salinum]QIB64916.1 TonB-dependent receptor [Kineobactrum salinum]
MGKGISIRIAGSLLILPLTLPIGGQAFGRNSEAIYEEVVVTAQKKSETLQKVSAAVSVVDNKRLTDLGVTNLVQITNLATGVAVAPIRSRANIYIRGVGQALASPNADANVALNLNGIYLPQSMAGTAFFDVDRVEILPGPQGTLYGRNSTGGVVNVMSRTPGDSFAFDGFLEAGNYSSFQGMAGIDIPVSDTLLSRTAVTHKRHDGYIEPRNQLDDQDSTAVRQTLVWTPGVATELTGVLTYTSEGGIGNTLINDPNLECSIADGACVLFDAEEEGYKYDVDVYQGSLTLRHDFSDSLTLIYIGGYSYLDQDSNSGLFSGPPAVQLLNPETSEGQSHEARLNVTADRVEGLFGIYYFDEDIYSAFDVAPVPVVRFFNVLDAAAHGFAVYGQGTYALTDAFRVTGGVRYSENVKSVDGSNSTFSATTGDLLVVNAYEGRLDEDRVDWKGGVEFDVATDSMLYANISSGFTPGGFSTGPQVLGEPAAKPFEPVTLVAYVAGVKNRLADGALTLNLEGFYYDYENYQISARDQTTAQNLVYNAEKSTVHGIQLDSRFKPGPNDNLGVSVTYLHAVADILDTPGGSFDGVRLPFSPRWTVNLDYQHAFDLDSGAQIRASLNFKYTSSRWTVYTQDTPGYYQKANTHTVLNLGYFAPADRWSIQLYVRNLEDNVVKTSCANAVPGPAGCYFEPPRTFGATLGFNF